MTTLPAKLQKERVALVLIDMQEKFRPLIFEMSAVIAGCSRLVRFCERLGIPMLVTEHYPRGLGPTISELRALFPRFEPLEKITFSCGGDSNFRTTITEWNRDQIILCGIETHVCVYQTAFDLLADGYQVTVAPDGVSSRSPHDREISLAHMRQLGVQIMSVEMILFEILKKAKTEDFKAVSDILKE